MTSQRPLPESEPAGPSGAQSVDRALALLALVGRGGASGQSLGALVTASGLNKPTCRRLLVALIAGRLVEQDPTSRHYHLGPEAFVLGTLAAPRHGLLTHAADALRRLAAQTGDTAFLSLRHGDHALCLHREEGSYPIRTHALQTGDQHPLGIGAGSLAMLAALPEPERAEVMARLAPLYAARPGYSRAIIEGDVAASLAQGFALNPGRVVASSWGVGVALRFPDGRLAGALSIAAIDARMQPERQRQIAEALRLEASAVEARLARAFAPPPRAAAAVPATRSGRSHPRAPLLSQEIKR